MFVDLDWPLNASSLLSASAELLVSSSRGVVVKTLDLSQRIWIPVSLSAVWVTDGRCQQGLAVHIADMQQRNRTNSTVHFVDTLSQGTTLKDLWMLCVILCCFNWYLPSPRRLCFHQHLFVCLFVSRNNQKLLNQFSQNSMERYALYCVSF